MSAPLTIRQALNRVLKGRLPATNDYRTVNAGILVAMTLVEASRDLPKLGGPIPKRTRSAQSLLLEYTEGKRRAGTEPAAAVDTPLEFISLTEGS